MKRYGEDILVSEAAWKRFAKKNYLDLSRGDIEQPTEYPCVVFLEHDRFESPFTYFRTYEHQVLEVGRQQAILELLHNLKLNGRKA